MPTSAVCAEDVQGPAESKLDQLVSNQPGSQRCLEGQEYKSQGRLWSAPCMYATVKQWVQDVRLGLQPMVLCFQSALYASGIYVTGDVYTWSACVLQACACQVYIVCPTACWTQAHADAVSSVSQAIATITMYFPLARCIFLNYFYLHRNCWHYSIPQVCSITYCISKRKLHTQDTATALLSPFSPLKTRKCSGYYINEPLKLRSRLFNWRQSNFTVTTKGIIYFPQERADVFAVHEQLPHQES